MTRLLIILLLTMTTVICSAADPNPRHDFQGTRAAAARFRIELNRGGTVETVTMRHRFQTGDRFRIIFELNRSSYVYVINRSIEGNPETLGSMLGTKGLNLVEALASAQTAPASASVQLLWPSSTITARLIAGQAASVPGPTQYFEFDEKPGLEKIVLVVSPYPIDPHRYVPGLPAAQPTPVSVRGAREDTNEDVLSQLEDLRSLEANTAVDPDSLRGICVGDCGHYSAPKNPARPFVFTADLMHFR